MRRPSDKDSVSGWFLVPIVSLVSKLTVEDWTRRYRCGKRRWRSILKTMQFAGTFLRLARIRLLSRKIKRQIPNDLQSASHRLQQSPMCVPMDGTVK